MARITLAAAAALAISACGGLPRAVQQALPADVLLLGEQHDNPEHQRLHQQTVQRLAERGQLAALALEMAEQGRSTAGLASDASEAAVQAALGWDDRAWPWAAYGPAVMSAVRAGVPVLGANLPRAQMRPAMADPGLDALLPEPALARQRAAIRDGHCGLLPEAQIAPMTRIQIARDRAMAQTLAQAAQPGRSAVLLAGSGHVDAQVGVPRYLPPALRVQPLAWPAAAPQKDYCAQLREQMRARPAPAAAP